MLFTSNALAIERARITDREIIESLANIRGDIKALDAGQKALQKQIDDLRTLILWGFGILFGGMGILIGFVIWDRRRRSLWFKGINRDKAGLI